MLNKTAMMRDVQVAEIIGVSVLTLRNWRGLGVGPPALKVGGAVRYRESDLESWIDSRPLVRASRAVTA